MIEMLLTFYRLKEASTHRVSSPEINVALIVVMSKGHEANL